MEESDSIFSFSAASIFDKSWWNISPKKRGKIPSARIIRGQLYFGCTSVASNHARFLFSFFFLILNYTKKLVGGITFSLTTKWLYVWFLLWDFSRSSVFIFSCQFPPLWSFIYNKKKLDFQHNLTFCYPLSFKRYETFQFVYIT